jgi:hypothetical protein
MKMNRKNKKTKRERTCALGVRDRQRNTEGSKLKVTKKKSDIKKSDT